MKKLSLFLGLIISVSIISQELIYDKVITTSNYSLPIYINSTDSSLTLLSKKEHRFSLNILDNTGTSTFHKELIYSSIPAFNLITAHNTNFISSDSNSYLITIEDIDCDYTLPEINIVKYNKYNDSVEVKNLNYLSEFSSNPQNFKKNITSSVNESELLLYTNNRLLKFNLNLMPTDTVMMAFDSVNHIQQLANLNYSLIKDDSIYIYNGSNTLQNTIGFPGNITNTAKINNDSLIIATTNTVYLVNQNYTILNQYNSNSDGIEVKAGKIWINYALPNQGTTLFELSKSLSLVNTYSFPNNKIIKNPIVSVNDNRTVYLATTNTLSNNLFNSRYLKYNLDNSAIQNSHLDVELVNVIINAANVTHYNPIQNPSYHTYHINPNISVEVQNNSSDTIKELYIQSTRITRLNTSTCSGVFFMKHFDLVLAPNDITTLVVGGIGISNNESTLTEADANGLISHSFCVNVLAPNMEVDADISNNSLCESITAYVSIKESENVQFSIFPNPASSILTINCNEKILGYRLLNIEGKTVVNALKPSSLKIDVSHLDKGFYFLELTTVNGVAFEKVLIQ